MHGFKKVLIATALIAAPTAASASKTISIDLIGLEFSADPTYGGSATFELQLSFDYNGFYYSTQGVGYDKQYVFTGTNLTSAMLTISNTLQGGYRGPTITHNFIDADAVGTINHYQSNSGMVGADGPGYTFALGDYGGAYIINGIVDEDAVAQLLNTQTLPTNLDSESFSVGGFDGPYYNLPVVGAGNLCRPNAPEVCGDDSFTLYGFSLNVADNDSAVPEPATWAMFIGGFGMIGSAMRRRNVAGNFA